MLEYFINPLQMQLSVSGCSATDVRDLWRTLLSMFSRLEGWSTEKQSMTT